MEPRPKDGDLETAFETFQRAVRGGAIDRVAPLLAKVMAQFLPATTAKRYFQLWEAHGFHVTRNHFYSPIPDTRQLSDALWERESALVGVDLREREQLRLLREVFPAFAAECGHYPREPTGNPADFHFNNGLFGGTDALVLYCLVRHLRPRTLLEVGSGYSTRIASQAVARNGDGAIVCIEPYPDDVLQRLPHVHSVIPSPVQEVDLARFSALGPNDILFIDSTHVVRTGGDVPFLYLEVLPRLRPGVVVHVHDIFLPGEYPRDWMTEHHLFWNEQYLLHAFLLFNSAFAVLFSNNFMGLRHGQELQALFPSSPWWGGGSFWMRRTA